MNIQTYGHLLDSIGAVNWHQKVKFTKAETLKLSNSNY